MCLHIKYKRFVACLVFGGVCFAGVFGCQDVKRSANGTAFNDVSARPYVLKHKLDGSFDDWAGCNSADTTKDWDWEKIQVHSMYPGIDQIHIKRFYYDCDDRFLYIFFKLQPSIDEFYGTRFEGFDFGAIYIDVDSNANTGCPSRDKFDYKLLRGSEVQIRITGGVSIKANQRKRFVMYSLAHWDATMMMFENVRTEESLSHTPLISYGKDGIGVAILRDDLGLTNTSRINLAFWPWPERIPVDFINWTTMK